MKMKIVTFDEAVELYDKNNEQWFYIKIPIHSIKPEDGILAYRLTIAQLEEVETKWGRRYIFGNYGTSETYSSSLAVLIEAMFTDNRELGESSQS
jgi:hypothetical protein